MARFPEIETLSPKESFASPSLAVSFDASDHDAPLASAVLGKPSTIRAITATKERSETDSMLQGTREMRSAGLWHGGCAQRVITSCEFLFTANNK